MCRINKYIILTLLVIFMVLPVSAKAISQDDVQITFTAQNSEMLEDNSLSEDKDLELYTLDEVRNQVEALDRKATFNVIQEDEKYFLEVTWSYGKDMSTRMELLKTGEELFICRGEDFRSMIVKAIISWLK